MDLCREIFIRMDPKLTYRVVDEALARLAPEVGQDTACPDKLVDGSAIAVRPAMARDSRSDGT
jgi:hypothetical protein